jgi:MYXO-CTERM domain-containing protein
VAYDLDFATDFNLLLNPNDPIAQHFAMWKTPTQLASLRSAPIIRITNRADSDMDITQLRLDLGDLNYRFDSFAFLEQPNDGPAVVTSHSDSTFGGDMETFLTIAFPNGLAPGDSFTFQVRLANLVGPGLANYEDVLWDKTNAQFAPDRTDNALVTVTAGNLSTTNPITLNFTPTRLFEYPLANANFALETATGASGFSTVLAGGHEMQIVGLVRFSQESAQIIPEPGTLGLASVGVVLLGAWRRRHKSVKRS